MSGLWCYLLDCEADDGGASAHYLASPKIPRLSVLLDANPPQRGETS
ncbi:MAG: hypothetical protein ACPG6P_10690 [Akkermansiaceae bacterium]